MLLHFRTFPLAFPRGGRGSVAQGSGLESAANVAAAPSFSPAPLLVLLVFPLVLPRRNIPLRLNPRLFSATSSFSGVTEASGVSAGVVDRPSADWPCRGEGSREARGETDRRVSRGGAVPRRRRRAGGFSNWSRAVVGGETRYAKVASSPCGESFCRPPFCGPMSKLPLPRAYSTEDNPPLRRGIESSEPYRGMCPPWRGCCRGRDRGRSSNSCENPWGESGLGGGLSCGDPLEPREIRSAGSERGRWTIGGRVHAGSSPSNGSGGSSVPVKKCRSFEVGLATDEAFDRLLGERAWAVAASGLIPRDGRAPGLSPRPRCPSGSFGESRRPRESLRCRSKSVSVDPTRRSGDNAIPRGGGRTPGAEERRCRCSDRLAPARPAPPARVPVSLSSPLFRVLSADFFRAASYLSWPSITLSCCLYRGICPSGCALCAPASPVEGGRSEREVFVTPARAEFEKFSIPRLGVQRRWFGAAGKGKTKAQSSVIPARWVPKR